MRIIKKINEFIQISFSILPIRKNRIVFCSSPDFYDNAWAFYQYTLRELKHTGCQFIWAVEEPEAQSDNRALFVSRKWYRQILRRSYYYMTAACIIYTHNCPVLHKRKDQLLIHTTHSASQLKAGKKSSEKQKLIRGDLILRCGQTGVDRFNLTRGLPKDRYAVIGMPRLDLLFEHVDCINKLVPDFRGNETVVIAMETFKQNKNYYDSSSDNRFALNIIKDEQELQQMNQYLADNNILLLIKIHHMQDLSFLDRIQLSNILYLTDSDLIKKGIQLYQLVENCDALLTDYSSVYYDFLLLNRQIGFMVRDMQQYDRGFIINDPTKEMPGEKITNLEELQLFFQHVLNKEDSYSEEREQLIHQVFRYPDNNNCKRLLELLLRKQAIKLERK